MPLKYYAVHVGRTKGIFTSWSECETSVKRFKGALYKSFNLKQQAEVWLSEQGSDIVSRCSSEISDFRKTSMDCFNTTIARTLNNGGTVNKEESVTISENISVTVTEKVSKIPSTLEVWLDGSCIGNCRNSSSSRAGCGVFFGDNDPRNISVRLPGQIQTNQRAEVYAAILALKAIDASCPVVLNTDSDYLYKGITAYIYNWRKTNYKGVVNVDLFKYLDSLISKRIHKPVFVKVPAHSGIYGNECADTLAKEGAQLRPCQLLLR